MSSIEAKRSGLVLRRARWLTGILLAILLALGPFVIMLAGVRHGPELVDSDVEKLVYSPTQDIARVTPNAIPEYLRYRMPSE